MRTRLRFLTGLLAVVLASHSAWGQERLDPGSCNNGPGELVLSYQISPDLVYIKPDSGEPVFNRFTLYVTNPCKSSITLRNPEHLKPSQLPISSELETADRIYFYSAYRGDTNCSSTGPTAGALCTPTQAWNIEVSQPNGWSIEKACPSGGGDGICCPGTGVHEVGTYWTLVPEDQVILGPQESISVTFSNLETTVQPGAASFYVEKALMNYDRSTDVVPLTVAESPFIQSFTVPAQAEIGKSFELQWSVNAATTSLTLEPGSIDVTGLSSYQASIQEPTTFTLIARGLGGRTVQKVAAVGLPLPTVQSFTAPAKAEIGTTFQLTWSTSGAASLTLEPGSIDVTGLSSYSPSIREPTTFTLIARGYGGHTARSKATVVAQPWIKSFSAELQRVGAKASVRLAWDAQADFITLSDDPTVLRSPVSPTGGYEIELGPGRPFQNVYTVTAWSRAPEAGAPMASAESNVVSTWAATGHVDVGPVPSGVAVSPDGTRVFVANAGTYETPSTTVSVLDTTTNPIVTGQRISVGPVPAGVAVSPDGTRVFVATYVNPASSQQGAVSVLDTATNPISVIGQPIPVGNSSGLYFTAMAVSPDGTRVFVANYLDSTVSVLDTTTNPISVTGQPITVGYGPTGVAVSPDGTRVFSANYIDGTISVLDITTNPISVIPPPITVGYELAGVAVSPDGTRVFVSNNGNNTISVFDITTNPISVIPPPITVGYGPAGVAVSPDGTRVFVANFNSDTHGLSTTVSVLDITTNPISVIPPPITVGYGPTGVAVSPDGTRVFVVNTASNTVSVLEPTFSP